MSGASCGCDMRATFTKFDPKVYLKNLGGRGGIAKTADTAQAGGATLAGLAGLAAARPVTADSGAAPEPQFIAPAEWFEARAQTTNDEPGFESPCDARRGRVEERGQMLLHFCCECGAWGAFGYGVNLRLGNQGKWYCARHRPQ
jgi:hypothetical protein